MFRSFGGSAALMAVARRTVQKTARPTALGFAPTVAFCLRNYGVRHKVVDVDDAVSIVKERNTICVSGFVTQGCPESLLRCLKERCQKEHRPLQLQLLFGGGPGDYGERGLNHLGQVPGLLRSTIGGHYGQVPIIANRVLSNEIPGWALPMGAISRMIRATASCSPGFITRVGLGTFVDPRQIGGALNDKALEYPRPMVELIKLDGNEYLRYTALPIDVAFIRATTADPEGNLTLEHESLLGDVKNIAMATRSSGGVVIAQVERIATHGSLPARAVDIPAPFVDCVVIAEKPDDQWTSFQVPSNPVWTGEIRKPMDDLPVMEMGVRKIIARRAAMELKTDDLVNLGIGMPEGVASVASEEGIFRFMTLTTEPGVIGGVGASGKDFGPGANPDSFNEMNQQFDMYNGGGLSVCFLGLAQCGQEGNVNVSRLSEDRLTGPGGFIDIAQSTHRVVFMGTFTKQGLKVDVVPSENDGKYRLVIDQEGEVKTFEKQVREITFAANQALSHGQQVLYVTERCVFELDQRGLKLIEIAPGMDLEKDILAHMEVPPYIPQGPDGKYMIREMDQRIFNPNATMNLYDDMFSLEKQTQQRLEYQSDAHALFIDFTNFSVTEAKDISKIEMLLENELKKRTKEKNGEKVHVVVNYDGFDCKSNLTTQWAEMAGRLQSSYYASVRRYSGRVFLRAKLGSKLRLESDDDYWKIFSGGKDVISRSTLLMALQEIQVKPTPEVIDYFMNRQPVVNRKEFNGLVKRLNYYRHHKQLPPEFVMGSAQTLDVATKVNGSSDSVVSS